MKHELKNEDFINWVIDDRDDLLRLGLRVKEMLRTAGKATVTSQELLNEAGYIPGYLLLEDDEIEDVDVNDYYLTDVEEDFTDECVNVLHQIDKQWCDNWGEIHNFFGKEIADKLDKLIMDSQKL